MGPISRPRAPAARRLPHTNHHAALTVSSLKRVTPSDVIAYGIRHRSDRPYGWECEPRDRDRDGERGGAGVRRRGEGDGRAESESGRFREWQGSLIIQDCACTTCLIGATKTCTAFHLNRCQHTAHATLHALHTDTQPGRHAHRTFDHEYLPGPRDGSCASPRSPPLLSPWCVASGRSCQHDRAPQVQRQLLLLSGGSARLLDHRVDSGARILGFRHTCLHVFQALPQLVPQYDLPGEGIA